VLKDTEDVSVGGSTLADVTFNDVLRIFRVDAPIT